ncbi:hypothetical protein CRYUN_Cryun02cG0118700 [Craigia yunnanensis]
MEEFPNMQVTNLPAVGSDHSPIAMNLDYKDIKNGRKFKSEASWLIMEECELIKNEGWYRKFGGSKVDQVVKKLRFCKKLLKEWSKKTLPNNQR